MTAFKQNEWKWADWAKELLSEFRDGYGFVDLKPERADRLEHAIAEALFAAYHNGRDAEALDQRLTIDPAVSD